MREDLETGCWIWTGSTHPIHGYGRFRSGPRSVQAHRFAYEAFRGEASADMECDHLCRVRGCVNPAHLEMVPKAENIRRGKWGTHQSGKTQCPKGHEYTPDNTYRTASHPGRRFCRACDRERAPRKRPWTEAKRIKQYNRRQMLKQR